ncbi:hypothetical protein LI177_03190 [bacterium 210820-DFI.6.37]|nr:hypothetical protein [bacterium 210820-DFI.6.37]
MKIPKYIISILLIAASMLFIGETYVWNLSEFESQYTSVTFYPQKGVSQVKMIEDIYGAAEDNQVLVFVVLHSVESNLSETIDVYGTEGTKTFLRQDIGLKGQQYHSLFLGEINVRIASLHNLPDVKEAEHYQVVGDARDIVNFKKNLVNEYAGAFPKEGREPFNSKFNILAVWWLTFLLLILLTIYQVLLTKKEMVIRLVSGENLLVYIRNQILAENGFYISIFAVSFFVLKQFTNVTWHLTLSVACMVFFLIVNSLCFLYLKYTDYKRDIGTKNRAGSILKISYFYKTVTVFLTVLIMSGCAMLIADGYDCYQQKDFFVKHKEQSYVMVSLMDDDSGEKERQRKKQLYNMLDQEAICALVELTGFNGIDTNYVYANKGALKDLKEQIPELAAADAAGALSEKAYIIKPDSYSKTGNREDESQELLYSYSTDENLSFESIKYKSTVKLVAQNGESGVSSKLKKNPVILFNNKDTSELDDYIWQGTLFPLSRMQWNTFLQENDLEKEIVYKTNAYANYCYQWQKLKRGMLLGIFLVTIMLFMESLIIKETLYYEYRINAVELVLKKLLGYRMISRYKRLLMTTILSAVIGMLLGAVVGLFWGTNNIKYILLAGSGAVILELAFMAYYIRKVECSKVQRILNGDML